MTKETADSVANRVPRNGLALMLFIVGCLLVGGIGGYINASAIPGWYAGLQKPSWTPPNQVFGPVWTFLYVCIGVAGWLVWRRGQDMARRRGIVLWFGQLLLNFLWTPLFFGLKAPGWAAVVIVMLWVNIGTFILQVRRSSPWAAILFGPYWVWVSYATALNLAIWWMNRAGTAA